MARGALIALSGIDCTGKTTQLELLAETLRARGERVRPFWYRPGYSPELDALRRAVRRARPSALPTVHPEERSARDQAFARPVIRRTWIGIALVDAWMQLGVKIRSMLLRGDVVLCDRYLPDAWIDLTLRFPGLADDPVFRSAWRSLEALVPTPSLWALLTLETGEMERRIAAKNEPFPDTPDLRAQRKRAYDALAARTPFVLDATEPPEAIHQTILERLDERRIRAHR